MITEHKISTWIKFYRCCFCIIIVWYCRLTHSLSLSPFLAALSFFVLCLFIVSRVRFESGRNVIGIVILLLITWALNVCTKLARSERAKFFLLPYYCSLFFWCLYPGVKSKNKMSKSTAAEHLCVQCGTYCHYSIHNNTYCFLCLNFTFNYYLFGRFRLPIQIVRSWCVPFENN